MRVGTKIDTISIYLSWNWVNQITISKIYQQRTLQGGTIVTSWGQEYKFFQKRCKKFGFYKKPKWIPTGTGTTNQLAICDDFGGTKYE